MPSAITMLDTKLDAALERITELERQNSDLQAANNALLERARNAQHGANERLRVAALNLYKMDWVWAHRGDGEPHLIGSKFWISLRDALGLPAVRENKWTKDQQRAAMQIAESHSPTRTRALRPGVYNGPTMHPVSPVLQSKPGSLFNVVTT